MHAGTVRYIGSGLLIYMLPPLFVVYGGLFLIQHSGPQLFTWLASLNSVQGSMQASPPEAKPPNHPPKLSIPTAAAAVISEEEETMTGLEDLPQKQSWEEDAFTETLDRSLEMNTDGRFSLSNISGHITVTSWNRSEVRIQATKVSRTRDEEEANEAFDRVEIDIEERDGHVSVETHYPDRWFNDRRNRHISVSVYYEITVPEQAETRLQSVSGHITVSNLNGEVSAKSVSGRIHLRDIANNIFAESVSGDVEARTLQGGAEVRSVSGRIEVEELNGDLEAHTTSGKITLRDVEARRIEAESTSGSVDFSGRIMEDGRYDIETMSGRIRLTLPSDAAFNFKAKTFSGDIDTDFPVTIQGSFRKSRHEKQSIQGMVNGGGAEVDLSAFSGNIIVRSRR